MNRAALEHVIRAASTISGDDEIVIVGSQSILGQFPDAPETLVVSDEAGVYPKNMPERAELIEGSIGELSPFHDTFGYYAQGVAPSLIRLPRGAEQRFVRIQTPGTRGATGLCLEIHDLLASKLIAGRDNLRFFRDAMAAGLADKETLKKRLAATDCEPTKRAAAIALVAAYR